MNDNPVSNAIDLMYACSVRVHYAISLYALEAGNTREFRFTSVETSY